MGRSTVDESEQVGRSTVDESEKVGWSTADLAKFRMLNERVHYL